MVSLYLYTWAILTMFYFGRTLLFHINLYKANVGKYVRQEHIGQHIYISVVMMLAQLLLFIYFVQLESEAMTIGHLALGAFIPANMYLFNHIRDEVEDWCNGR